MEALFKDFLIIFGLATVVLIICHRLKLATTVGLLLTGIIVGPSGLGLISASHEVEVLAEVGVVLLLFSIGIEFSMESLLRIKKYVFFGGAFQVIVTILIPFFISRQLGLSLGQSVFIGFLVSLSSTAIVLRLIQQRAEVESPHGQLSLGILIFQDIVVVPMMLMTPLLAGMGGQGQGPIMPFILKTILFLLLVVAGTKWIVPRLLYLVARTRSRELFVLSTLVLCFSIAFLSHSFGLSLALGAFLAGLIISETEFSHETLGNIIPFRDVFTSLFFISIGMLLDPGFLIENPGRIVLIASAVMVMKFIATGLIVLLLGFPIRTSILTGLTLCQVGEFSFILFMRGAELGILAEQYYQFFLNVSIITMGITPFAITLAPKIADSIVRLPMPAIMKTGFYEIMRAKGERNKKELKDHLIIIGYGLNGRNLARTARMVSIPYVVIEMNPQTVGEERAKGEPIYYGDASQESVLDQAFLDNARIVVIVISDPIATQMIITTVRNRNQNVFIIVRTRFVSEMQTLLDLGANQVIPEEFETSVEMFSRVLGKYLIPRDEIERIVNEVRAGGYEIFRTMTRESAYLPDLKVHFPELEINTFRIKGESPFVGISLGQIDMRKRYGINLLAIQRGKDLLPNPDSNTVIEKDDLVMVLANSGGLSEHCYLFFNSGKESKDECDISERN